MSKQKKKQFKSKPSAKSITIEAIPSPSAFNQYFPFIITGAFLALSFVGITNHDMWRDEFQAWLVARDAHSFSQLLQNMRYEGNPVLWHFFLYLITSVTHNPFWMQVFNIFISASFVFLFNRYSPFTLLQKFLFTFGYYSFFEFNIISRSYGLGLLLVIIFCVLYKNRYKYYLTISIVLFLLANTHVFGLIFSSCFGVILLLDYIQKTKSGEVKKIPLINLTACIIIISAGCLLSAIQIYPKSDNTFPVVYPTDAQDKMLRFQYFLFRLVTSCFALPRLDNLHFWNTNTLEPIVSVGNVSDFGNASQMNPFWPLLIFIIFFFSFIRKPIVLLLYIMGTGILVYISYYLALIYTRYYAHLFILLLATLWISSYYDEKYIANKFLLYTSSIAQICSKILFYAMLAVSFIGGVGAYYKSMQVPFSASAEAARFLRENKLDKLEIIGSTDFIVSPLAAILDRTIYYPESNKEGSFIIYNKGHIEKIGFPDIITSFQQHVIKGIKKMLFITENPPSYDDPTGVSQPITEGMITADLHIQLLKEVKSGIVSDEKYFIYMVEERK